MRHWHQANPESIRPGDVVDIDSPAGILAVAVVDSPYSPGRGPIRGVWADPAVGVWKDTGYKSRRHFSVPGAVMRKTDPSRPWQALNETLPEWQGLLIEIEHTGTTDRQWLARKLARQGLLRRSCITTPCDHCTCPADCFSQWVLTASGRGVVHELDPRASSVPLDDWSLAGQMEFPL